MTSIALLSRKSPTSSARLIAIVCMFVMLCPAPQIFAAPHSSLAPVKLLHVAGTASNTVTSVKVDKRGRLRIEAVQVGHLSHFGFFTGEFSYEGVATPTSIFLEGNATLTNDAGEQLFISATILESGTGYPYEVTGTLIVTGGTGRFAGASGSIAVKGV